MSTRPDFPQLEVFSSSPLFGNPLAVVQECGIGRVRRDSYRLAFAAPPLRRSRLSTPNCECGYCACSASARFLVSQGTALERRGRIHVERAGADTWIGGEVSVVVKCTITV